MENLPIEVETALSTLVLVNNKESKIWQECERIVKSWIEVENLNANPDINEIDLENAILYEFDDLLMEFHCDVFEIAES